jgi:hypothetical protein
MGGTRPIQIYIRGLIEFEKFKHTTYFGLT